MTLRTRGRRCRYLAVALWVLVAACSTGGGERPAATGRSGTITPPRFGLIAFAARGDIWISAGHGEAQRVTHGPEEDFAPSWLPARTQVAFRRSANRNAGSEVFVVDVAGGDAHRWPGDSHAEGLAWSPTGTEVAYSAGSPGDQESRGDIIVAAADGSGAKLLAGRPEDTDEFPSWSPDGEIVTYASTRNAVTGAERALWRVRRDGSAVRLVAADGRHSSWSPDGRQIAFEVTAEGAPAIAIAKPDGTARNRLTGGEWPMWVAPDWILFQGTGGLVAIHPDGTGRVAVDVGVEGIDFPTAIVSR